MKTLILVLAIMATGCTSTRTYTDNRGCVHTQTNTEFGIWSDWNRTVECK